jgi:predicted DNA-binding helix-hairpin-helix protein
MKGRRGIGLEPGGMRAGATTQFVVGLGRESDRELLSFAEGLEKKRLIHHPQFAAFRPIRNTPLENVPGTPPLRERRLYQADHLMREYGFSAEELVYGKDGHLPLDYDPKLTWALGHPDRFPVELTTAGREELRRVPGLGLRTVERILEARAMGSLRDAADLRRLGVQVGRAGGFVTLRGRLIGRRAIQAPLFVSGSSGEVYDFSSGTFR